MSDTNPGGAGGSSCSACGKPVAPNMRRCPACGGWVRPWSVGGKKSRWARYEVGGSGRPEDRGVAVGEPGEVVSSVWAVYGKNKDHVQQQTPTGQWADWRGRSGAPRAKRERNKKK